MPTHTDPISQVYARSLFQLAEQAGGEVKINEVADELEQITEIVRSDRSFAEYIASPVVDAKRREETVRRIFSNRVTDLMLRFLLVLNGKGRLDYLESIGDAYDRLVQEAFGRVEVDVFTPTPIDPSQLDTLKGRIRDAIRQEPVLYAYTDPSMIGGIKLRIGDQLIDGSVAGRLRRLQQNLATSGDMRLRERGDSLYEENDA